jgi:hypothetical protein
MDAWNESTSEYYEILWRDFEMMMIHVCACKCACYGVHLHTPPNIVLFGVKYVCDVLGMLRNTYTMPSAKLLSKQCRSLDVSQPHRLPRPVTGTRGLSSVLRLCNFFQGSF